GGSSWPAGAREAFERFVTNGGGVFILHSANNAFRDWPAYDRFIGLGWRSKDQGWALGVRPDGTLHRIPPGEGGGTSHGARTNRLIHRLGNHPIHEGLPREWMTPEIEVYTHARGPAEGLTVLSWTTDPETGTGWPIEWVVSAGKGRVYNSTFGHVWRDEPNPSNLRCAGFQTLMVRALQWLAKRPVTLPVPDDFPGREAPVLRPLPLPELPTGTLENRWRIEAPLLEPGPPGAFDETAVKDPSIVRADGRWHLFYTARGRGEYTTGYVSAAELGDLPRSERHELTTIRGKASRYGCAPQVFCFAPQGLWYL
ncbi:MAG: ThuA domain-containing protein, partial [Verrucomicrobiae bacterium]|nr:ThuA domain-containing protein [Verrucomicrobiae bacterium]